MIQTLIIAALAIWQVVNIWSYSELFATQRASLEARDGFFSRLLRCPFCLSNWVSAFVVCTLAASEALPVFGLDVCGTIAAVPAQIFAAARLANLCNDFFKFWDRTPRYTVETVDGEVKAVKEPLPEVKSDLRWKDSLPDSTQREM